MNKPFLSFFFLLLVVLSCTRCKEECNDPTNPDCPNYVPPTPVDPCAGSSEVSADFTIEIEINAQPSVEVWKESSYCLAVANPVRIRAQQNNATSYKWLLGSDVITTQEYVFIFPEEFIGQTIPITLIVEAPIDSECFPNDDGKDTLVKYITVKDYCNPDIYGWYRGSWLSAPNDSFDIKITKVDCFNEISAIGAQLTNVDQEGDSCDISNWSRLANDEVAFSASNSACSSARGEAHLEDDLYHIVMDYRFYEGVNPFEPELWTLRQFRGRKLD